jgi:HAD superfamily hydrolase (TIGR01509 family)
MKFRAAVFDLEGTLVDDTRFHFEAWGQVAKKIGASMSESVFFSFNGMKNEDVLTHLLGRAIGPAFVEVLGREKDETYRALCQSHLAPVVGAAELLARLRDAGVKIALASTSSRENRTMVLEALSLGAAFDVVVDAEGMPGKPEPDVFLAAARALDVPSEACVAFEDSWNGVKAAASAGMSVIGMTTNVDADVLVRGGAVRAFANYTELPSDLGTLLAPR